MVVKDKVTERVSTAEKARILRENGIDVYQWFEHGESQFRPMPTIFFSGGEEEGLRAVRVMQEHGFYVGILSREWTYCGSTDPQSSNWAIVV